MTFHKQCIKNGRLGSDEVRYWYLKCCYASLPFFHDNLIMEKFDNSLVGLLLPCLRSDSEGCRIISLYPGDDMLCSQIESLRPDTSALMFSFVYDLPGNFITMDCKVRLKSD